MRGRRFSPRPSQALKPGYFLSISLQNIRCFGAQQTLDLSDGKGRPTPFTILLGDNGTGKTTLLQLLVKMRPMVMPSLKTATTSTWGLGVFYEGEAARSGGGQQHVRAEYGWGDGLSAAAFERKKLKAEREPPDGGWSSEPLHSPAWRLVLFGYGASRRMSPHPPDMRQLAPELSPFGWDANTATLFDDSEELINGEAWLMDADYAARMPGPGQAQARARFETVKRLLIALLPDGDILDLYCEAQEQDRPTAHVAVVAKTHYGKVPLRQLSLGYRTLFAWMVDLAARLYIRYPTSGNPLAEPAVVLVDEIDLHLHPRWQRQLFSRLAALFPNVQFIVTAHSPLVVQAAPSGTNVVVLRRPKNSDFVVIEGQDQAVKTWRLDQIVTSELFGLPSARSPEQDVLRSRRRELLRKPRLSGKEAAELHAIEAQLTEAPGGETPEEMRLQQLVYEAARELGLPTRHEPARKKSRGSTGQKGREPALRTAARR